MDAVQLDLFAELEPKKAWVVAALIYGLFIYTAFAYFGEIVLWLQEAVNG